MPNAVTPVLLLFGVCAAQSALVAEAGDEACSLLQTRADYLKHRPDYSKHRPEPAHEASARRHADQQLALGAVKRQHLQQRVCDPAADTECKSMCRWLKLTKDEGDPDSNKPCKLVEWTMRTCGYTPPSQRSESDPIDCVVDSVRVNVLEAEVQNYAQRLGECVGGLPNATALQYQLLVQLLERKLGEFGVEAELKANVTAMAAQLESASAEANQALEAHAGEERVIKILETTLGTAELLPGHYLVHDIHKARRLLERLIPIPPVRRELRRALREGKTATDPRTIEAQPAKQLGTLWPLIVRLNVSVHNAEALNFGEPLPEAKEMLKKLRGFRRELLDFRSAMLAGNVSLGTKTEMRTAVDDLESASVWANDTGFVRGLPRAEWLVNNLERSIEVLQSLRNATELGEEVLNDPKLAGLTRLNESVTAINNSLNLAFSIGIGGPGLTRGAQVTLDELEYLQETRRALRGAEDKAESILDVRRGKLSEDEEEEVRDELRGAVTWARESNLGVKTASADLAKLKRVEGAKTSMTEALALGAASAKAKVGEHNAIKGLSSAIATCVFQNVTAGVADARKLIDLLHGRVSAKHGLDQAQTLGKHALASGSGYKPAINALKMAMDEAEEEGLDELLDMAQTLLDALQTSWDDAKKIEELDRKGKDWDATGEGDISAKVGDKKHVTSHFKRHGYRVTELTNPDGANDDGDDDFDEHIQVLEMAIGKAHQHGVIDPRWEVMIKELERKRHAFLSLEAASEAGVVSMKTKHDLESSIEKLTTALAMSSEAQLKLGVPRALKVLKLLSRIEPAELEFQAALLQANISCEVQSHMSVALVRLEAAVAVNEELDLRKGLAAGRSLVRRLSALKSAHSTLKAAVVQGEAALFQRSGEESAFKSLDAALKDAAALGLKRDLPVALDLHEELAHMNEEQEHLADAVSPLD